jgi:transcriptional regulator GlxA family with amidase domain
VSTTQHNPSFLEQHYTVAEIAELWAVSEDTVRRLFLSEPGVVLIHRNRRRTRTYKSLRIPQSVAEQVYKRLAKGGGHGNI